jgi:hypothetical protein
MKFFWIGSVVWIVAVAASAPLLIEAADQRGVALLVPGLSVTASEILFGALVAFGPPLAAFWWLRRRRSTAQ